MHEKTKINESSNKNRIIFMIVCLLTVLALFLFIFCNIHSASIILNGEIIKVTTFGKDPSLALKLAKIDLQEGDKLDSSDFNKDGNHTIKILRRQEVVLFDGKEKARRISGIGTVSDVLKENNVKLGQYDELDCDENDVIFYNMKIKILRAFPVYVETIKKIVKIETPECTVKEAIEKAGVTINEDSIISLSLDEKLTEETKINIQQITYKERTTEEILPFESVTKEDATLEKGVTKLSVSGKTGIKTVTYKDKYKDDELINSKVLKEVITKNPVNEVKLIGTKEPEPEIEPEPEPEINDDSNSPEEPSANVPDTISQLEPPSNIAFNGNIPTNYTKIITGKATAYSGSGRTATGKSVMPGYVAVNPKQIPYHTKMWIVSDDGLYIYGFSLAEDTGGFASYTGNKAIVCDLYFPEYEQACDFGKRNVTIYILE